ncbi:NUDIX hydrolase [Nonomuraea sediminis]|uniref:NUDIX hydrolase n=1 Tax=Nonomuraea sediminis TaxID=2835864 RepID=UPI001BDBC53B|nr:NUDIX hydrolase [Nonomuraea sediminis]
MLVNCVGAVILLDHRLLLVRRGHPPGEGLWSIPGGRVEPGESDVAAVEREVLEETGLVVEVGPLAGTVVRGDYLIRDYLATVTGGTLTPGDDAADARWCTMAEMRGMPLTEGLLPTLTSWGTLDGLPD